ncbi:MAG: CPXCG motif-containing cysteine-rich protein [Acidobacteriota bacterium]|nr:CPXCG motif-containing cysteine-rich protein [Acidobacteriota bacterium]
MILGITTAFVSCPYCGEPVELSIDATLPSQQYVEDCEVCCRPMVVTIDATADEPVVNVTRENE